MATRAVGGDARIHSAIGAAIHDYSSVEAAQVEIVMALLSVDIMQASTIFHSIQNVRSRNDMIAQLIAHKYGNAFKFWAKCSDFLFKLSIFRNAIVHWHPFVNIYQNPATGELIRVNAIGNPKYGKGSAPLELNDFAPFGQDCGYIRNILNDFAAFLRGYKGDTKLPDKYLQPTIRPNKAVLRPIKR